MRENQLLTLIFSTASVIFLLLAYFLVNSSAAQMMPSPTPTPTPTTTNLESSFVIIGLAIIVAGAIIAIYFFYSKNKNKKIDTVSESKFTAAQRK